MCESWSLKAYTPAQLGEYVPTCELFFSRVQDQTKGATRWRYGSTHKCQSWGSSVSFGLFEWCQLAPECCVSFRSTALIITAITFFSLVKIVFWWKPCLVLKHSTFLCHRLCDGDELLQHLKHPKSQPEPQSASHLVEQLWINEWRLLWQPHLEYCNLRWGSPARLFFHGVN